MRTRKRAAFSLVEMSIIIGIIALLIAGIVVKKNDLIAKARNNRVVSATQNAPMKDMEGLTLWMDTATTESFKNTEFVVGSAISQWKNIAPDTIGTFDAAQATAANRPVYNIDAQDGMPFLYFDGVNDILTSATIYGYQLAQTNQITVFVVQKYYASGGNYTLIWDSGSNRINAHLRWNDTRIYWDFGNYNTVGVGRIQVTAPTNFDNQWKIITLIRKTAATSNATIRINGSDFYTSTMTGSFNVSGTSAINFGSGPSRTDIREVIIFKRELAAQEIKDVEKYLSKKWDIDFISN